MYIYEAKDMAHKFRVYHGEAKPEMLSYQSITTTAYESLFFEAK